MIHYVEPEIDHLESKGFSPCSIINLTVTHISESKPNMTVPNPVVEARHKVKYLHSSLVGPRRSISHGEIFLFFSNEVAYCGIMWNQIIQQPSLWVLSDQRRYEWTQTVSVHIFFWLVGLWWLTEMLELKGTETDRCFKVRNNKNLFRTRCHHLFSLPNRCDY